MIVRQTAYRIWIQDLINGEYHKEPGEWDPNYLLVRGLKVSRVNSIATVVDKYTNQDFSYAYLELDDGSGRIKVKAWREDANLLREITLGALILVIGRVREFNNEVYLTPEIVKELQNYSWAKLRRLELLKVYGDPIKKENVILENEGGTEETIAEATTQTARKKIISIIGSVDEITYDDLVVKSGLNENEVEDTVKELIKEGEVYMPRPNYLRCI